MVENPPKDVPQIYARLCYRDVPAAADWLTRSFGFAVIGPDPREALGPTEMSFGTARIMLGEPGAHGLESPAQTGAPTHLLIVYVDDVDAHHARAREAGAAILSGPDDMFWGDRRYEARDPEGHRWSFHQHVRDVSPEEQQEALRKMRGR